MLNIKIVKSMDVYIVSADVARSDEVNQFTDSFGTYAQALRHAMRLMQSLVNDSDAGFYDSLPSDFDVNNYLGD
jgi:hypothetical protein